MGVDIVLFPLKIEGVAKSFGAGKSTPMRILAGATSPIAAGCLPTASSEHPQCQAIAVARHPPLPPGTAGACRA